MASGSTIADLQKKAYGELNTCLIEALEKGEITPAQMRESADFIRYHLDATESTEELLLLLDEIGNKWPAYRKAFITFKHQETADEDALKMQALQEKLRQFATLPK